MAYGGNFDCYGNPISGREPCTHLKPYCCTHLEKHDADPNYNYHSWWVLDTCVSLDHYECLTKLIEQGVCVDADLTTHGKRNVMSAAVHIKPPITTAACHNAHRCVRVLLEKAKVNPDRTNSDGKTALMYAMEHHSHEMMNVLMEFGCDTNIINKIGRSALSYGADNACPPCIQKLIDKGASLHFLDIYGRSALMYAATTKKSAGSEIIKLIIEAGAMINHTDNEGYTAVMLAAKYGNEGHLAVLLEAGAETHQTSISGNTLLHCAAMSRSFECIRLILADRSTKVNVINADGLSALDVHIDIQDKMADPEIIELLYCAGNSVKRKYWDKVPAKIMSDDKCPHLEHLCVETIRNILMNNNGHVSRFFTVQQLPVPFHIMEILVGICNFKSLLMKC